MAKLRRKVRTFFQRLSFAWKNARRAEKQLKRDGIVFLPNGSVIAHPRRTLAEFGYRVEKTNPTIFDDDISL